jgi:hypothetical protein
VHTTFQRCPEPGARLFVPAPRIDRAPTGDQRYAFELWLRRANGRSILLQQITYTSSAPIALTGMEGTPALTALLLPAMRLGLPLELEAPVSARVLAAAPTFQDIFATWMDGYQRVPVEAVGSVGVDPAGGASRGVAAFFSGGVDGFHTLKRNLDDVTHLVYLHGFDIESDRIAHRVAVEDAAQRAADDLGRELVVIQTNVRDFSDAYIYWGEYCGAVLGTSAQLLQGTAHKVLVAASNTYADYRPFGTTPLTDPLFSTEWVEVVHDGADAGRFEKVQELASWDLAMRHLRVCWSMHGTSMNCGGCEKCMRTMTALFLAGALHRAPTFPERLDPKRVARARLKPWDLHHVQENLKVASARGLKRTPLMRAWRDCLARESVRLMALRPSHGALPEQDARLLADIQREVPGALRRWVRRPGRWLSDLGRPQGRHVRALWNALRGR